MQIFRIETDSDGNLLPENFKIEHLIKLGVAQFIPFPLEYQDGLILRYFEQDKEILVYLHSKKLFDDISDDFHGVEMVLSWALMDADLAKKLANYSQFA